MITVRKSNDRGTGRHGWLTSHHTFSFANYHDPKQMGFRTLRVINEDTVTPGRGFGAHQHADMEIISIVLEGALAHKDSTGGEGVLRRGEVQRMSAGSGVVHSEFNGSQTEPVHFFQIWIEPAKDGITPGYEQKLFPDEERRNRLRVVAAPGSPDGAVDIHQDARLYASLLDGGAKVEHELSAGRGAWIQVASGTIDMNGTTLAAGDGAAIENETKLTITAKDDAEFLLFDLA
ncbi:MAG: quercetin 2,3-dioxygenase [Acidobacteriota bacterium]|jgi:redox-sensitive bicupin YhaK (pirin superfamily)|nr:quercetin 2,3-dioxygenase [Acidobacteriota bacterium]